MKGFMKKGMESMKEERMEMKMSPKKYREMEMKEGPKSKSGKKGTYPVKGKTPKAVKIVKKK
jgi:hypothetical protein